MTDISPYVKSSKLTYEPTAKDEQRWRDYMASLQTATVTISGRFDPEPERYQVTGTYRECHFCYAPPHQAPLPEGWTVSLHRAPNPLGSHLKTEEPIYITMHTAECTREQR
jgi:hypothetical protein